jgi:hypothetical protein
MPARQQHRTETEPGKVFHRLIGDINLMISCRKDILRCYVLSVTEQTLFVYDTIRTLKTNPQFID